MNYLARYLLLPLFLAGSIATAQAAEAPASDLYDQLKTNKVVRVGTEGTYAPFSFHDTKKDNLLTGFDVELAREVFKRLGIETVEFVEAPWDGLIAGVDAGRYDVVVNQVGITPERQEKYDFSQPYISAPMVLITHADNDSIKQLSDIKDKKAAQTLTSNFGKKAVALGAELVSVDGFAQAIDLLISKRADVTLNDRLSFFDFKKQKPDAPVKIVASDTEAADSGILVKKGNPALLAAINKALDEIKADGTYAKISEQFFGVDVSKP
ncbi:amino acid ABC transporter substrate-binding protein [Thiofilum flexile]|uniref:amino acid ABC transporter substrate-binding protein n=1 Tax=Thiofilum flexile TaxID=125627 RepID=UPI00037B2A5A|nr:amino acid ABC transporter substrate-binding protein [Thiofilum flexile]